MPKQLILASGNKGKLAEFGHILSALNIEILPQGLLGVTDADETGLTFVENAILKARHACQHTGLPALADDSGLEVDLLSSAPGIYSARYGGANASDQTNIDKLLDALKDTPWKDRTARFRCVLVCMRHENDPTPLICMGTWEGRVLEAPQGEGGFGYDPIFWSPEFDCSAAELSPEQKQSVSHRGKAVIQFEDSITAFLK